jgi:hypothetical protein
MSQFDLAGPFVADAPVGWRKYLDALVGERAPPVVWGLRTTVIATLCLFLFASVAVGSWYVAGAVVPWDSKNHFYPMYRFLAEALSHHQIPFWNPYHFSGYPAVADPQSLIFTPTMFLFAWLVPTASMQVFDAVIYAHLLMGGIGVLGLFRRRGWHPAGAVLAALIFMLGGPAASRLQHTGMIISYGFIPLALWALEVAIERVKLRHALVFALAAVLMTLGRDQVAFLAGLMLVATVGFHALASGTPIAYLRRRFVILATGGFVCAALIAVPVLLTMQFIDDSNRPGIAYGVAAAGSLAPVNFITMLAPNFFGSLDWNYDYWGPGYETMVDPDWTDRAINYLFIGTLPVLLILWHGLAGGRLFGRRLRLFSIIALGAILYAVGRSTPVFAWAFDLVPGVSLYRRPADATFILNFAFALTSGYLLHRYIAEGVPNPFRRLPGPVASLLTAASVVLLGLVIGFALLFPAKDAQSASELRQLAVTLVISAGGIGLLLYPRGKVTLRVAAAAVLVAATAGELVWRNAAASIDAEPAQNYSVFATMTPDESAALATLRNSLAADADRGEHPRVEILGLVNGWQNASMVLGLEDTLGYNPLRISTYERAVGPGENAVDPNARRFPGTFRGYKCTLASLLGLEYLVLDRPLNKMPRRMPRPRATEIYSGAHIHIYRLGTIAPRAYFATQLTPIDVGEVLDSHTLPEFNRSHEALIDKASMAEVNGTYLPGSDSANANVVVAAYHDNHVVVSVDTDKPGIVVLNDIYYPGWEAKVDRVVKPILRTNVLFRGVEVPAGHHIVSFEFHPLSLSNLMAAAAGVAHLGKD